MQFVKKVVLALLTFGVIAFISWQAIFNHLDVGEEPVISDVIIVPEGQTQRMIKAVKLLKTGYSKSNKLIISPVNKDSGTLLETYQSLGAPKEALISEPDATSTWTNATNTIAIMEEHHWKSALVVTSDHHTLRTKLAYDRASKGKDLKIVIVSAYKDINGEEVSYKEDSENKALANREVIKYIGYLFYLYNFFDL